jgi:xylan 1,4-beta-xylosidase
MVCPAIEKVHEEIVHSTRPSIPLIVSEFNATYMNEQAVTDSIFMGPWMADTIRRCDGLAAMMSYWTFSDVFEEQGVIKTPFYGGFGLMAEGGIPKPAFSAFALLHDLGTERLAASSDDVLVTRRKDGTIVIAAWNLLDPDKFAETRTGASKTIGFDLMHIPYVARATIRRVDAAHGDTLNAWKKMGSPQSPTQAQIVALRKASEIGPPEQRAIHGDTFSLTLPPMGLALIEIPAQRRAAAEPMH